MNHTIDPFEFAEPLILPEGAETQPGLHDTPAVMDNPDSKMDRSTAVSHYNRWDGIKSIVSDMQLKLRVELERKGSLSLTDELYLSSLGDVIAFCTTLQTRLPWSPVPAEKL